MTETLIPDKAESTAAIDGLDLRTQLFIDGGSGTRTAAPGSRPRTRRRASRSRRSPGAAWRTSTRRSRRRARAADDGAGAG